MYRAIIRPLLFSIEPEKAHRLLFSFLNVYRRCDGLRGWVKRWYRCETNPFNFAGLTFMNRIGLSAGFDKGGENFDELSDWGFGFIELGTVTPTAQSGNPAPCIFRLPQDLGLISRTGFNNPGVEGFWKNLQRRNWQSKYRLGININKDAQSVGEAAVEDFLHLFRRLYWSTDYFTLNWGSVDPECFEKVVQALDKYRQSQSEKRLILLKLPADISQGILEKVLELADKYQLDGFVATGPTLDRSDLKSTSANVINKIGVGWVCGKVVKKKSLEVVRYLASHKNKSTLLIGAGGVMEPEDVKEMLVAGADLVQIYSAFIYSGPGIVKKMAGVSLN